MNGVLLIRVHHCSAELKIEDSSSEGDFETDLAARRTLILTHQAI